MPSPKKGASARSTTAGGPKKARWSTEQRAAQGKSPVRPRGTVARPVRERQADSADRRDNVERGQSTRPNWEPRDKAPRSNDRFGAPRTGDRSDRPAREGGYPRTERPAREGYAPRTDRAPREGGYQGRTERPTREGGYAPRTDRAPREGGYQGRS